MRLTAFVSNQQEELHTISYTWKEVSQDEFPVISVLLTRMLEQWVGQMEDASLIGLDLMHITESGHRSGSLQHINLVEWMQIAAKREEVLLQTLYRLHYSVVTGQNDAQ